jgi:hypothetical protein
LGPDEVTATVRPVALVDEYVAELGESVMGHATTPPTTIVARTLFAPGALNSRVYVPAAAMERSENDATPPAARTVVVPPSGVFVPMSRPETRSSTGRSWPLADRNSTAGWVENAEPGAAPPGATLSTRLRPASPAGSPPFTAAAEPPAAITAGDSTRGVSVEHEAAVSATAVTSRSEALGIRRRREFAVTGFLVVLVVRQTY